jgi:hypothetical protein
MIKVFIVGLAGVIAGWIEVLMVQVAYGTTQPSGLPLWVNVVIGVSIFGGLLVALVGGMGAILSGI